MRFVHIDDERVVVRPSERDLLARGAVWLFLVPWVVAALGWLAFALVADEGSTAALALTSLIVGVLAVVPALIGMVTMATAHRRVRARTVEIDVDELIITFPGRSPEVLRMPDRVAVRASGITWKLETEYEGQRVTLLSGVLYGSGRDLARAAKALAEHLDVDVQIPVGARRARGFIPDDPDVWAAICYAPLDGVNLAYSLFALMTSREPRLRFAAKQSLALLALEGALAFVVCSCLGLPLVLMSLPLPLEVAVIALPLLALGVVRLALRVTAAVRAHRGRAWAIPPLSLVSRRWLPEAEKPQKERRPEKARPAEPAALPRTVDPTSRDTPIGDPFSAEGGR